MDDDQTIVRTPVAVLVPRCSAWSGPGAKGTEAPYYPTDAAGREARCPRHPISPDRDPGHPRVLALYF